MSRGRHSVDRAFLEVLESTERIRSPTSDAVDQLVTTLKKIQSVSRSTPTFDDEENEVLFQDVAEINEWTEKAMFLQLQR